MGYIELNGTKFLDLNDACVRELYEVLSKNGVSEAKYILEKMYIKDIVNKNFLFYVKDYQRGYRWSTDEVISLLEDIEEIKNGEPYCIQPLVVKKIKCGTSNDRYKSKLNLNGEEKIVSYEEEKTLEGKKFYELIDGQQRLTTLLLILNLDSYCIYYELLRSMDEYYINIALDAIDKFFKQNQKINKSEFIQKIKEQVFFIWYEISDDTEQGQSNKIFKNINAGKIELTNAELFRALLLNEENISKDNHTDKNKIVQFAFEWDKLEQQLRDDDFWYFIAGKEYHDKTRIDYLLELYALILQKSNSFKKIEDMMKMGNDVFVPFDVEKERYSFNVVKAYLDYSAGDKFEIIKNIWEEIVKIYNVLYSWYEDNELYHYIGYLVAVEDNKKGMTSEIILNLYEEFDNENKTKTELKERSKNEIYKIFNFLKTIDDFKELTYKKSKPVYKFLLFFNIWSTMQNKKLNGRFPFRLFKKGDWDIEHIRARKLKKLNKDKQEDKENVFNYFECLKIDNQSIALPDKNLDKEKMIDQWNNLAENFADDNDIGNLTLLSSEINRSYGNGFFDEKRSEIIKRDQVNAYIPLCTRNVFLKYYTDKNENTDFRIWSQEDKNGYTRALETCCNEIINQRI